METYKLDRILTWLSSGIGFNESSEKRYFYDKNEMLFFNVAHRNGVYCTWTNQIPLSLTDCDLIKRNIVQLNRDKTLFLEIFRSTKEFNVIPITTAKTTTEFEDKERRWKNLYAEVDSFLKENCIDIYKTRLIE